MDLQVEGKEEFTHVAIERTDLSAPSSFIALLSAQCRRMG
jgi:hypothetical protein